MAKKVKSTLKLMVKEEDGVPFGELEFVWATSAEMQEYIKQGFVRAKKVKRRSE